MMPEIIHQLTVAAPPSQVRDAITTAEGLGEFWTDQVRAEPKVGSEAWFGFGPNAETQFRFDVTSIGDDGVDWKCIGGPDEWVDTTVRWQLVPHDSGTTVRFEHRGWKSESGDMGQCSFVWGQVLARLAAYVDEGRTDPFFRKAG
jgi:uncharacterized protein YndB with AHSA1/START domain